MKKNLKIYLASPRGFCAGVKRAIEIVEKSLNKYGKPVYVRHEIVHNKQVVNDLREKGAIFIEELSDIKDNTRPVIFSAHGVPKSVPKEAEEKKLVFVDATCPLVSKVHRESEQLYKKGYDIILIGHNNHTEVIGTMGQLPNGSIKLIETADDVDLLKVENFSKPLAYITQTTLSVDDTAEIIDKLKRKFPNIKQPIKEDICYATTNRQQAVKSMAKLCDTILVIGAQNSSNSLRLVEVALGHGVKTAQLIPDEYTLNKFLESFNPSLTPNLGLTAGASAPETLVQVLISKLKKDFEVNLVDHTVTKENVTFNLPKILR